MQKPHGRDLADARPVLAALQVSESSVHLVMFDVDGTLLESYGFDSECFRAAIHDVLAIDVEPDWERFRYVTDSGILNELFSDLKLSDVEAAGAAIKGRFIARVSDYIAKEGVAAVPGSVEFIRSLRERPDVTVAIATGGWIESAKLKLESAGFDLDGLTIASGSDHYDRTKIMEIAHQRTSCDDYKSKIYFGDRVWDMEAANSLGYMFVAVGGTLDHPLSIPDFRDGNSVLHAVGL